MDQKNIPLFDQWQRIMNDLIEEERLGKLRRNAERMALALTKQHGHGQLLTDPAEQPSCREQVPFDIIGQSMPEFWSIIESKAPHLTTKLELMLQWKQHLSGRKVSVLKVLAQERQAAGISTSTNSEIELPEADQHSFNTTANDPTPAPSTPDSDSKEIITLGQAMHLCKHLLKSIAASSNEISELRQRTADYNRALAAQFATDLIDIRYAQHPHPSPSWMPNLNLELELEHLSVSVKTGDDGDIPSTIIEQEQSSSSSTDDSKSESHKTTSTIIQVDNFSYKGLLDSESDVDSDCLLRRTGGQTNIHNPSLPGSNLSPGAYEIYQRIGAGGAQKPPMDQGDSRGDFDFVDEKSPVVVIAGLEMIINLEIPSPNTAPTPLSDPQDPAEGELEVEVGSGEGAGDPDLDSFREIIQNQLESYYYNTYFPNTSRNYAYTLEFDYGPNSIIQPANIIDEYDILERLDDKPGNQSHSALSVCCGRIADFMRRFRTPSKTLLVAEI